MAPFPMRAKRRNVRAAKKLAARAQRLPKRASAGVFTSKPTVLLRRQRSARAEKRSALNVTAPERRNDPRAQPREPSNAAARDRAKRLQVKRARAQRARWAFPLALRPLLLRAWVL